MDIDELTLVIDEQREKVTRRGYILGLLEDEFGGDDNAEGSVDTGMAIETMESIVEGDEKELEKMEERWEHLKAYAKADKEDITTQSKSKRVKREKPKSELWKIFNGTSEEKA